jgi:hypothetical protein
VPSNLFSVGRDCQLVVMGPYGRIDLTHVTGFESRQVTAPVRVDRIDGVLLATELPKGWEGAFDLERGSSTPRASPRLASAAASSAGCSVSVAS